MRYFKQKHSTVFRMLITTLVICFLSSAVVWGAEDGIERIDITAELKADGSCDITEVWKINNVYEGTEYYIALHDLDGRTVNGLVVTDDSGTVYETLDSWNTEASFADKAYRCGILEVDDGYELCWGISEMGDRTYTISYHLTGLVRQYSDHAGMYHRFISDELSSAPEAVSIVLSLEGTELSSKNAQIWAAGYDGEIQFENGSIAAWSLAELGSDDYVNVLVEFADGLFQAESAEGTFETVRDRAMSGDRVLIIVLCAIAAVLLIVIIIVFIKSRHIKLADGTKVRRVPSGKAELMMTVPFKGSIPMTCAAFRLDSFGSTACQPLAAYITKWQLEGIIRMEKERKEPVIIFTGTPGNDKPEAELFAMIQQAGSKERLYFEDWQEWAQEYHADIIKWGESAVDYGLYLMLQSGLAGEDEKGKIRFTKAGYELCVSAYGYRRFLQSFNAKNNEIAAPREYWGEYLVFAALFNLTDDVAEWLEASDHSEYYGFCEMHGLEPSMFLLYMSWGHTFSDTGNAGPETSDGSGGMAASSGGGGFSGGGGGGSR